MKAKSIGGVAGLMLFAVSAFAQLPASTNLPPLKRVSYTGEDKQNHLYLVQEPAEIPAQPRLLIYMHGAGGKEEQGMGLGVASKTFVRLRGLMHRWQWVYVCPRDPEFTDLLKELQGKYHPSAIYLAGASAGGREAFGEAWRNPGRYDGLLLMCPATSYPTPDRINVKHLTMPIWIATGEKDMWTGFSRELVKDLQREQKRYHYEEIPGGGHDDPVIQMDWEKALRFLLRE